VTVAVAVAEFDLKTLCEKAGVTPRTVHFYVQQGLLPPAGAPGPGARYGEGHILRLKLIRLLQRQHLPLAEISKRLKGLSDDQVRDLVREVRERRASERGSALDYIRGILTEPRPASGFRLSASGVRLPASGFRLPASGSNAGIRQGRADREPEAGSLNPEAGRKPEAGEKPEARSRKPAGSPKPEAGSRRDAGSRSQWERYELTDGIELHVRRPLSRMEQRQLDRILAASRDIVGEEEEG
jgi:DNA-binding transcriptional MerR regulator